MPLNILAWNNKIGPQYYYVGAAPRIGCWTGQPPELEDPDMDSL